MSAVAKYGFLFTEVIEAGYRWSLVHIVAAIADIMPAECDGIGRHKEQCRFVGICCSERVMMQKVLMQPILQTSHLADLHTRSTAAVLFPVRVHIEIPDHNRLFHNAKNVSVGPN